MGNVLGSADPLEQVPAFQRQPPPMRTLAETAEGTVLAKTRPADDPARERTVNQLETQFSGELALTAGKGKGAPSTPAASAAVYVPRGDSGTRGLVDDPAQDETQRCGTTVLVVKVCHDLRARFCLFANHRRGAARARGLHQTGCTWPPAVGARLRLPTVEPAREIRGRSAPSQRAAAPSTVSTER